MHAHHNTIHVWYGWLHLHFDLAQPLTNLQTSVSGVVPQWSVPGPILFLVYINDFTSVIVHPNSVVNVCRCLLYHCSDDYLDSQLSITAIEHWSSDNHLQLNSLKYKCMIISRTKTSTTPSPSCTRTSWKVVFLLLIYLGHLTYPPLSVSKHRKYLACYTGGSMAI